jgi:hypothetical protein
MGKVKRLELWWQPYLYVTSVSGLRKKSSDGFFCVWVYLVISNKFWTWTCVERNNSGALRPLVGFSGVLMELRNGPTYSFNCLKNREISGEKCAGPVSCVSFSVTISVRNFFAAVNNQWVTFDITLSNACNTKPRYCCPIWIFCLTCSLLSYVLNNINFVTASFPKYGLQFLW